jgi:hypothetical protein
MTPFERKDMPFLIGAFIFLIVFVVFVSWYYSS